MPGLSERKIEIVRSLVEASPDRVVGALHAALSSVSGDAALDEVRRVVEAEAQDRRMRNAALQPVAAMFVGDGKSSERITFPVRALALIWRGLKAEAPADVAMAAAALADFRPGDSSPEALDELARIAAEELRSRSCRDFAQAAALCDEARPGGAALLCGCLDLSAVARRATLTLGEWITRMNDAAAAAARLAYRDAVAVAEDAGGRFFEILAAQLAHPWMVLRIISAVMDKPNEKYLAQSELASFALRVMDDIDRGLQAVARMDADGGPAAAHAAAKAVEDVTLLITELEGSIVLVRPGPWAARVAKQRQVLVGAVEERLRAAEKTVLTALPTHAVRIQKVMRDAPRLTSVPDPTLVKRTVTLFTFACETRSSAANGGFASARAKLVEKLGEVLDSYLEEVLERLRSGEVENVAIAQRYLAVVADFNAVIRDRRAAELVRRRAAAAVANLEPVVPPPAA